jgi:chromosome segregation protein
VQFQKLKLIGFKSFVEATEFRIEPGLTGIVGPNGCGKSNLLEGLRWVMGATSAKAMRGAGMDDVIFNGSDKRPSRNWAEVTLSIDNAQRLAPQPFTDQPVLEVARRIDRGQGSTYRVNGKEVRARDVQLLFADASTGANSPALVRQGQISELINAKPQNRRRVLEEASGISGLHTRRHDAELRLRAAEANLSRLEDISKELDGALSRLKREARQAEKYKKISAEIRSLGLAILYAKWLEAFAGFETAKAEIILISQNVEITARRAAVAQTEASETAQRIGPLREEETIAATIDRRISIEKERLDVEAEQALANIERLKADLLRVTHDQVNASEASEDSKAQVQRLTESLERIRLEISDAPSREPELKAMVLLSESERVDADAHIERLASELAALTERKRLEGAQLTEAKARFERLLSQLNQYEREKQALGAFDHLAHKQILAEAEQAITHLKTARSDLEDLEGRRNEFLKSEAHARTSLRDIDDRLGRDIAESRGLAQILNAGGVKSKAPLLDFVRAEKGYELALAAALGEDLNLSLASRLGSEALSFWSEDFQSFSAIIDLSILGAKPLSDFVIAPEALSLRLKAIGVVTQDEGERLQGQLPMGARLVSLEGDLWRWDGLIVRAKAPKPAAIRLSQRRRFDELEADIDERRPLKTKAQAELELILNEAKTFEETLKLKRHDLSHLERNQGIKSAEAEASLRRLMQYDTRLEALDSSIKRLRDDLSGAKLEFERLLDHQATPETQDELTTALVAARNLAQSKRQAVMSARQVLDEDQRNRQQREGRERTLSREFSDWGRRHAQSSQRLETLMKDEAAIRMALKAAEMAPDALETRRLILLDQLELAQGRLSSARDALSQAEAEKAEADKLEKATGVDAALARENRAGALARLEAATQIKEAIAKNILTETELSPQALGERLKEEAIATPSDAAGAEALLSGLERERDQLGAVNLRAEDEASDYQERLETMSRERLDLTTAIAKLRDGIDELNAEGRERLLAAFDVINAHFKTLFVALFGGGTAELRLIESDDPLEAGLEIYACPPGKRLSSMSLMSGGEQALTATALIFGVFLANPAPICVLDEVDAPLDDANVDRYCRLLDEMRSRTQTRFIAITHNPVTMSRMDRLYGVTMSERGISQLVSVDLGVAESMVAQ